MHQADTTEAQASTTLPSPEMPAMGQHVRVAYSARAGEPARSRIAVRVPAREDGIEADAYDDGAIDLLCIHDEAEPEDEGHVWTLLPSDLTDGTASWEPGPQCQVCEAPYLTDQGAFECAVADVADRARAAAAGAFRCEVCGNEWPTAERAEFCADADYALAEDRRAGMAEEAWEDTRCERDAEAVRS